MIFIVSVCGGCCMCAHAGTCMHMNVQTMMWETEIKNNSVANSFSKKYSEQTVIRTGLYLFIYLFI